MTRAYIGIGTNIEPERHVRSAVEALRRHYGAVSVSPVYASAAVGFSGDDFYNLVAGIDTPEPLEELAATLAAIEREHGRTRSSQRFAPRTLDLDILTYGDVVSETPQRRLPRKEITRYAFVLKPLADLAPDERHPELELSYRTLWERFDGEGLPLSRVPMEL